MSGDTENASNWPDADVWIAPLGSTLPADVDSVFPVAWDLVGLLDGDAGFKQSRAEDRNDFYAWGGSLVRISRRHFKQTLIFTALEDNDTTRSLIWPGSEAEGISGSEIVVPRPANLLIAFELREGPKVKRLISAGHAQIDVNADIVDNEADITRYELLATIFPDTSEAPPVLWIEQKTASGS